MRHHLNTGVGAVAIADFHEHWGLAYLGQFLLDELPAV
jgi:hypothetical protein